MKNKLLNIIIIMLIGTTLYSEDYYRIKNKWSKEYIYVTANKNNSVLSKNNLGSLILRKKFSIQDLGGHWVLEKTSNGYFNLKNRLTKQYMHNSNQLGNVELSKRPWKGKSWIAEPAKFSGYYRLSNRFNNQYMHIEERLGHIQLIRNVPGNWWSALWMLEKIN